jgi:hypothetical protein
MTVKETGKWIDIGGAAGITGTADTEEFGSSRNPKAGSTVIGDSGVRGGGPGDADAAEGGEAAVDPGGGDAGGDEGGD